MSRPGFTETYPHVLRCVPINLDSTLSGTNELLAPLGSQPSSGVGAVELEEKIHLGSKFGEREKKRKKVKQGANVETSGHTCGLAPGRQVACVGPKAYGYETG